MLEIVNFSETINDIGGLENLKEWLARKAKVFSNLDKAIKFGVDVPKGIMIIGMPGCGKSLTAKATASLFEIPLVRLDVGRLLGKYVGESEENMRKALKLSEAISPCVLWIDEIEKAFAGVGGDGGGNDVTTRLFGQFLTWMQEKTKPVFVVATANNISDLPPELLRKGRFDEIFFVDLPTQEERKNIFQIHLNKHSQTNISDIDRLAELSKYFNGAEIEEAVKEAMFLSYVEDAEKSQISIRHLEKAIEQIVPLAQTMKRKIDGLRDWATTRARPASSERNTEKLEINEQETETKVVQTKREKEEDIF